MSLALALSEMFLDGKGACRVHGGGFGGTCMIFIDKDEEESFKQKMSVKFPLDQFIHVEPSSDPLRRIPDEDLK